MTTNLEKLQRGVCVLQRKDAPIEERLARAYLFGLAWVYPDKQFAGYEQEFETLRDEVARVYYGEYQRGANEGANYLRDLEHRVIVLAERISFRTQRLAG